MKKEEYRLYYRTDASAHYLDLAKQTVEIAGNEARIELNGQLVRCVIEDVERASPDRHARSAQALSATKGIEEQHW